MRRLLVLLLIMAISLGVVDLWLLRNYLTPEVGVLPTLYQIPTLEPLPSLTPSQTWTATHPPTMTLSPTITASATFTATPTLADHVLSFYAVMPGVELAPTSTQFSVGITLLSAPPHPIEPLPDATNQPPPYEGWHSFESDHPNVRYSTSWEKRQVVEASRGQYHRTENSHTSISFPFDGEALRIRYVAARNMGIFDLYVDGLKLDTIDAYSPELSFPGTQVYILSKRLHLLEIHPTGQKNGQSEGIAVGLDAIQVYRGSADTLILTPVGETLTPTSTPQSAHVELIAAPPTLKPTTTESAPGVMSINLVIAYDENGNKAVDPAEGVRGISVRVVESSSNRVIAESFTDEVGYAQIEFIASKPARVVVPYFGKVWELPRSNRSTESQFTLLLTPGNQPGLIP